MNPQERPYNTETLPTIRVRLTPTLYQLLENDAHKQGTTISARVRDVLAAKYAVELPIIRRGRKPGWKRPVTVTHNLDPELATELERLIRRG